jgi:hypothetical protein
MKVEGSRSNPDLTTATRPTQNQKVRKKAADVAVSMISKCATLSASHFCEGGITRPREGLCWGREWASQKAC